MTDIIGPIVESVVEALGDPYDWANKEVFELRLRKELTAALQAYGDDREARGRNKAVDFMAANFNDEFLEGASGLGKNDIVSSEAEEGAFWMMWSKLLAAARLGEQGE